MQEVLIMRMPMQMRVEGDEAAAGALDAPMAGAYMPAAGAEVNDAFACTHASASKRSDAAAPAGRVCTSVHKMRGRVVDSVGAAPSTRVGTSADVDGASPAGAARRRARAQKRLAAIAIALAAAACIGVACWQYVPGVLAWLADAGAVRAFVADHAILSRLAMLGINMAQVLLAFLPGEPVELASGYAFGFIEGTFMCLIAAALATTLIYAGVRRWGWKLVGLFFDRATFDRFSWLQDAKRLELVMLVVFLIPGTPKDFLTYFAGLTGMRFAPVVLIATFGRIPSIVTSTIAASAFGSGNYGVAVLATVASFAMLAVGGALYKLVRSRSERTA